MNVSGVQINGKSQSWIPQKSNFYPLHIQTEAVLTVLVETRTKPFTSMQKKPVDQQYILVILITTLGFLLFQQDKIIHRQFKLTMDEIIIHPIPCVAFQGSICLRFFFSSSR